MLTSDYKARKAIPLQSGCYDYFPDALAEVAKLSRIANEKHNPGEPLHWSKEKSNDHGDALQRHQQDRGKPDPDMEGLSHSVSVAWRALAQLQVELEWAAKVKAGQLQVEREEAAKVKADRLAQDRLLMKDSCQNLFHSVKFPIIFKPPYRPTTAVYHTPGAYSFWLGRK